MADDYDSPWKEAIERFFVDFLAFYFPEAHAQIDWGQPLIFLEQELRAVIRDAEIGKRVVDKLARVTQRGGSEEWIYIHLEIQGDEQIDFPERMFVYHNRLFDRYRKPVASLALLADNCDNWRPTTYQHEVLGCRVGMHFPVAKLLDWAGSEARLEDSKNPFALLTHAHLATRATRGNPEARTVAKLALIRRLYRLGLERQHVAALFHMIDWMMRLPACGEQQFWSGVLELEEETKMQYMTSFERQAYDRGMALGEDRGQHAGKMQLLTQLLVARFGELPDWVHPKLAELTNEELGSIIVTLLTAGTLEAVFGRSQH